LKTKIKTITISSAISLIFLTFGCSMIPEYRQPAMPVAETWPGQTNAAESDDLSNIKPGVKSDAKAAPGAGDPPGDNLLVSDIAWQDYFQSQPLKRLIQRSLENNRDLTIAVLNIERAKAAYRIQRTELLPTVAGKGSLSRQRIAEEFSTTGQAYTEETAYGANLGIAAYELDFFGRVRSLNKEALEIFLATEEAALTTRLSLIAQTADSYMALLAQQKLLVLANSTFNAQKKTYDVIKRQFEVGSATQLDLAQAATSVESARVSIARHTRLAAQAKNALTLLVGTYVEDILNLGETIDDIKFIENLPAGIPSQILLARPDIRQAEHTLKAANADIGGARAALYPSITLTGSAGFASMGLSSLIEAGSLAWNFAPSLTIPIFNRDGLRASLAAAEANEKIAAAKYEKAIQTAFREVADELAARRTYKNQLMAQNALVMANRQAYDLSKARYENGIDNFLTVLDSQRALFVTQQNAIILRQEFLSNLVNLYRVMGGGQI
jgi:multidrug efflux system outer membrane protein